MTNREAVILLLPVEQQLALTDQEQLQALRKVCFAALFEEDNREAVKKATAMKPMYTGKPGIDAAICPACNGKVGNCNFCPDCGQALE